MWVFESEIGGCCKFATDRFWMRSHIKIVKLQLSTRDKRA